VITTKSQRGANFSSYPSAKNFLEFCYPGEKSVLLLQPAKEDEIFSNTLKKSAPEL